MEAKARQGGRPEDRTVCNDSGNSFSARDQFPQLGEHHRSTINRAFDPCPPSTLPVTLIRSTGRSVRLLVGVRRNEEEKKSSSSQSSNSKSFKIILAQRLRFGSASAAVKMVSSAYLAFAILVSVAVLAQVGFMSRESIHLVASLTPIGRSVGRSVGGPLLHCR